MIIKNRTYENKKVELDGNEFHNCIFKNCEYIYRGRGGVKMESCTFQGTMNLTFWNQAGDTVQFLKLLYSQEGFRPFVENVFRFIRDEPQEKSTYTDWDDIIN